MSSKQLWPHMAWAAAAVAAFMIGSKSGHPTTGDDEAAGPETRGGRPGLRSQAENDGSHARGPASAGNRGGNAGNAAVVKLFGSYSVDAAGIAAVAEQAVRDPNPLTRRLAFAKLLEAMTPENAREIRGQLVALGARGDDWNDFNYAWGAIAGREAFEFARNSDETDLGAALAGWAAADPVAAIAELERLPEELEGQRHSLEQTLVSGIADTDLNLATQMALRFGADDPRQGNRLIDSVAGEFLRSGGPEEASRWVETLPDGDAKGIAMRRVAGGYVRSDPEAAASWVEQYANEDFARWAVGEIGDEWAEEDPQATMAWLESLPEGEARNAGFSEALGEWEDRDPEAAGQYLLSMDPSPQRDAAIAGFARGYAWQDPATALQWAQSISDPQLRERSLTRVAHAYLRREPAAALEWLKSSGLSGETRQPPNNPAR